MGQNAVPEPYTNGHIKNHERIESLVDILENATKSANGMVFVTPQQDLGDTTLKSANLSYQSLCDKAKANAPSLRQHADRLGSEIVLIHQGTIMDNIIMFWSVLCAGLTPAMSTPLSADSQQRSTHLIHLRELLQNPICLTTRDLASQVIELQELSIVTKEEIIAGTEELSNIVKSHHTDIAALMLTSGSTGNAKAVKLSTDQIFTSVRGKSANWGTKQDSVFLNWIGLDHVANLSEIHLQAMMHGAQQIHVQASDVISDPSLFLRIIDEYQVSHTFAPNFFLAMLEKELITNEQSDPVQSFNLGSLRSIMSGGEANVLELALRLSDRLRDLGAHGQVIRLGYGLTEAVGALAYGMLDPEYELEEKHEFASIGRPITGALMRVTDETGELEPYSIGNLELSGPVVFKGYFRNQAATQDAFTHDGWFQTGDRAYIDKQGKFNLVGRSKELLNINGVKFAPQDIESALDKASLEHALASYFATFSYRKQQGNTEGYCIIYCAKKEDLDTVEEIAKISSSLVSLRPDWIIPLSQDQLDKSSLGKLSRTKLQKMFNAGAYDKVKIDSSYPLTLLRDSPRKAPTTDIQRAIVNTLSNILSIPEDLISINHTIFELGMTSVFLFVFERQLRKRFQLDRGVSIITFLSNPVIESIAEAIENDDAKVYNPVAKIQSKGTKTPLWLIHPAIGNTLAFLPLARIVTDRPLFALSARGLRPNEPMFPDIAEMADTYLSHILQTQPEGPYALVGYSFGSTVAFEIVRRLEARGAPVAFCAALDSPPYVQPLVQHMDWTAAAVFVIYFLELIAEDQIAPYVAAFQGKSKRETVEACLEVSRPEQRAVLNLSAEQLFAIVEIADNFVGMAKTYRPEGMVRKIDVFVATPLHTETRDRGTWVEEHLGRWQEFSRERIGLHECEGEHAYMLNPTYVEGFERRLRKVLDERGI